MELVLHFFQGAPTSFTVVAFDPNNLHPKGTVQGYMQFHSNCSANIHPKSTVQVSPRGGLRGRTVCPSVRDGVRGRNFLPLLYVMLIKGSGNSPNSSSKFQS
jgi:hypothetical protein